MLEISTRGPGILHSHRSKRCSPNNIHIIEEVVVLIRFRMFFVLLPVVHVDLGHLLVPNNQ